MVEHRIYSIPNIANEKHCIHPNRIGHYTPHCMESDLSVPKSSVVCWVKVKRQNSTIVKDQTVPGVKSPRSPPPQSCHEVIFSPVKQWKSSACFQRSFLSSLPEWRYSKVHMKITFPTCSVFHISLHDLRALFSSRGRSMSKIRLQLKMRYNHLVSRHRASQLSSKALTSSVFSFLLEDL